jgi:deoxyuridine 5'-triphosphate nucleotidohydrolase
MKYCAVDLCTKIAEKRGWCSKHYTRYRKYGNTSYVTPNWRIGRNNPNCRHLNLDDTCLDIIDTQEKAYLLGWIASDGSVRKDGVVIKIHERDRFILYALAKIVGSNGPTKDCVRHMWNLHICSTRLARSVAAHLSIPVNTKKDSIVKPPRLNDESLQWAFMRGFFDGDGSIRMPTQRRTSPECSVASYSPFIREFFANNSIGCDISDYQARWYGVNALDFMGKLYGDQSFPRLSRKYDLFLDWSLWTPTLSHGHALSSRGLRYSKLDPNALPLVKHNSSDSGYDIAIIKKNRELGPITLFGTGIRVRPPDGYYFDLVPRSSIIKTGYMLANSVGIIDRSYVGEVMVGLIKVDPAAPDLSLPSRVVQLIPRPILNIEVLEVSELSETQRGEGGFGSTGR